MHRACDTSKFEGFTSVVSTAQGPADSIAPSSQEYGRRIYSVAEPVDKGTDDSLCTTVTWLVLEKAATQPHASVSAGNGVEEHRFTP